MGVIMDQQLSHRLDALQGELNQHLWGMEHRLNRRLDQIMTEQQDIDAAVSALTTVVGVVADETDSLNTTAAAIQAYIDAHPNVDTTGLDAIVAQVQTTQGNLATAVTNVGSVLPQPPTPTPPPSS